MIIRTATHDDLQAITEIYNEVIRDSIATFDTVAKSLKEQEEWFRDHGVRHPILVAEDGGAVVGWAALSPWSARQAYEETAELSFYVKDGHHGQGIGRKLTDAILHKGRETGLHVILSRIAVPGDESLHLHEALGFQLIGTMREVGKKFGRRLDVHLFQKTYK